MKRLDNIYSKICSISNLLIADTNACKGKMLKPGVREHKIKKAENLLDLHKNLVDRTYKTSQYKTFTIFEPKERLIYMLPYYPDRIVHHAIMNQMEDFFVKMFTKDTYSCIKHRGIHGAFRAIKKALSNSSETKYCLQFDIVKFYPSVNHDILKALLLRKIKDGNLLWLLNEIIDSADGLPIGNYLSQYLANFYLSGFDHWIKEEMGVKYYFRYADDIAIFSGRKEYLHQLFIAIKKYLSENLKLEIKGNYQIFPIEDRGLNMVGYIFRHRYILLRPSIKKSFCRMAYRNPNQRSIASYNGWLTHCNGINLTRKILQNVQTKIA